MFKAMKFVLQVLQLCFCCTQSVFTDSSYLNLSKFKKNQSTDSTGGSIVSECRLGK